MNKLVRLVAAALALLASTAAAVPQGSVPSPDSSKEVANVFFRHFVSNPPIAPLKGAQNKAAAIMSPRQVHNADYGSGNGPTGNPQPAPAQQTTPVQSSTPAAQDAKSTPEAADSSSNNRRELVPDSSHDVNYSHA